MSGNSNGDQPDAKRELKPSKETQEKMQPVAREQFLGLIEASG